MSCKRRFERRRLAGFTLIEMMITVAIIGILAGVAIQGYRSFLFRSQLSEAPLNLHNIVQGEIRYYSTPHFDPSGQPKPKSFLSLPPTPPAEPCSNGSPRYDFDPTLWSSRGWNAIYFSPDRPHYYQYRVETSGVAEQATMTAIAKGNLDCDTVFSTFKIFVEIKNSIPKIKGLVTYYEEE